MLPSEKLPTSINNKIPKLINLGGCQNETYHLDTLQHTHPTTIANLGNRPSLWKSHPCQYSFLNINPQKAFNQKH